MDYYDPHEDENFRQLWNGVILSTYNHLRLLKERKDKNLLTDGLRAYEWFTHEYRPDREEVYLRAERRDITPAVIRKKFEADYDEAIAFMVEDRKIA